MSLEQMRHDMTQEPPELSISGQLCFNDGQHTNNTKEARYVANESPTFQLQRVPMPTRRPRTRLTASPSPQAAEILDVHMTAELLTVSLDMTYDLFKAGELPGRKVGRKWLTTRRAILRWMESPFAPGAQPNAPAESPAIHSAPGIAGTGPGWPADAATPMLVVVQVCKSATTV
jgi:excisionase family DNA binding protein